MDTTLTAKEVEHFDLRKPHMQCTGAKGEKTIVQNGFIYAFSIIDVKHEPWRGGKIVGKVGDMKAAIVAQGHKFCDYCGYSFGMAEGLERHLYEHHRDTLLVSLINNKPADLKLGELPTEGQLKDEATRIVTGEEAEELLAKQEEYKTPEQKAHDENKTKKKGAYRQPIGA
jgi:hypothetical protein